MKKEFTITSSTQYPIGKGDVVEFEKKLHLVTVVLTKNTFKVKRLNLFRVLIYKLKNNVRAFWHAAWDMLWL